MCDALQGPRHRTGCCTELTQALFGLAMATVAAHHKFDEKAARMHGNFV